MANFLIKTFGCQFNELSSAAIVDALSRAGHERVSDLAHASLVVINTCAVRAKAEEKAFSYLGEAARVVNSERIVFMGCVASLDRERATRIAGKGLHVVGGSAGINDILNEVANILPLQEASNTPPYSLFPTASVEVIRGCESYCTFCIVPRSRGTEIATDASDVLRQAGDAIRTGFSEILLLGQNVNRYRSHEFGFTELVSAIDRLDGIFWLWFLSAHPANFASEGVRQIMGLQHIEHHIHLPLQSGSNHILSLMNRRYLVDDYARLVEPVRENSDWALTTDVIVGFPGETERDFADTFAAVRRFAFDNVFLAKYSDRPGTPASHMQSKVPQGVVDERHALLLREVQELRFKANERMVGKSIPVLVLNRFPDRTGFGRSRCGKNVWFKQSSPLVEIGTFITVTVSRASREGLYGVCAG